MVERCTTVLARLLTFGDAWSTSTPLREGIEPWENPNIPAGYTYFAQLVAHDLVQTTQARLAARPSVQTIINARSPRLDLDTLYGAGPAAAPQAYAISHQDDLTRYKLRLSHMRPSTDEVCPARPPYRDIGRGSAEKDNGRAPLGATEALIADIRNDDHAIISQLLTVFSWFHNSLVDRFENEVTAPANQTEIERREIQYLIARHVNAHVYRRLIRNDLLGKLLHPEVLEHYRSSDDPYIDRQSSEKMPVEFSHGAFRFGHAMVRRTYFFSRIRRDGGLSETIEESMLVTSRHRPFRTPVDETWVVQWSEFFELSGDHTPNLSRRIGPDYVSKLTIGGTSAETTGRLQSLAKRDLMRGVTIGVWSVPALIKELSRIAKSDAKYAQLSHLLPEFVELQPHFKAWLNAHNGGRLDQDQIDAVVEDPPLMFFILWEAMHQAEGKHLGVLGSIVVAETLYKATQEGPPTSVWQGLNNKYKEIVEEYLNIDNFPEFINKVAQMSGLQTATPAFL